MPIRVALAIALAVAIGAPPAVAGMPRRIKEPVFACPKNTDSREIANLYATDPAAAGKLAEKRKCEVLPAGLPVSMTDADIDTLTACVVAMGEKRCLWIPSGKTVSVD